MSDKNTILRFQKNADKTQNKIVIPKFFTNKWGRVFIMEVDNKNGKIVFMPFGKEGE